MHNKSIVAKITPTSTLTRINSSDIDWSFKLAVKILFFTAVVQYDIRRSLDIARKKNVDGTRSINADETIGLV